MSGTSKKRGNLLFSGVLVLTISNILVKLIGMLLKVPLQRILGDGGMAYYNVANDIYVWLYTLSTTGLPTAIAILTSETRGKGNLPEAKKLFRVSLWLFVAVGAAGTLIMLLGSRLFADLYQMPGSRMAIIAIAPTLLFVCVSSCYRGYFQGFQRMTPTAVSELIAALGKLCIGISLAYYTLHIGRPMNEVAAYTLLGLTVGFGVAMVYLMIDKARFREEDCLDEFSCAVNEALPIRSSRELLKQLLAIGIPITLTSSMMSFTNVLDGMILSDRLHAVGYVSEQVEAMFGNYKTCAVTLFNLPPALIYPICSSIVPFLTASLATGKKAAVRETMDSSLRIGTLIALPCAVGLAVLSEPILKLLFAEESAQMAAPLLSVLAIGILFLALLSLTNAILQAHKLERIPIWSTAIGCVVKLAASYLLIGIPGIEMFGAPIGTCLCYMTALVINLIFLYRKLGYIPSFVRIFLRPFLASALCGGAAAGAYLLLSSRLSGSVATLASICAAGAVYVVAIFLFRAITREDILMLPKGERIAGLLHRIHLI